MPGWPLRTRTHPCRWRGQRRSGYKPGRAWGPMACLLLATLQAAGKPLVPMLCQAYNQTFVALATDKGASGYVMANPAWLSVLAMQAAVKVLSGQSVPKTNELSPPCFYKGGSSPAGTKCQA